MPAQALLAHLECMVPPATDTDPQALASAGQSGGCKRTSDGEEPSSSAVSGVRGRGQEAAAGSSRSAGSASFSGFSDASLDQFMELLAQLATRGPLNARIEAAEGLADLAVMRGSVEDMLRALQLLEGVEDSIKIETGGRLLSHMLAKIKLVRDYQGNTIACAGVVAAAKSDGAGSGDAGSDSSAVNDVAASIKSICLEYFDEGADDGAVALLEKLSVDMLRLLLQGGNEDLHIMKAAKAVHDAGCLRGLGNMSFSPQLSVLFFHHHQVSVHGGRTSGKGGRFSVASSQSIGKSEDVYGCALHPTPGSNTTAAAAPAASTSAATTPAAAAPVSSSTPAVPSAGAISFSPGAAASLSSGACVDLTTIKTTIKGVAGSELTAGGGLAGASSSVKTSGNRQAHDESQYKPFERKLGVSLVWKLRAELELKKVRG